MTMQRLLILAGLVLALTGLAAPAAAEDAAAPAEAAEKRIAFSFDDVPRHPGAFFTLGERTQRLIEALEEGGVEQAAFFVTTGNIEDSRGGESRIARYVAAGHVIANHSDEHRHLSETQAETYLADIDRAQGWLAGREGARPWFRYPFLDEGREHFDRRDAVRAGLAERGLSNGYVTIDGYDWFYDDATTRAIDEGRKVDLEALGDLFVESHVGAANFFDGLARKTFGRSPVHVMLLHETDVTALFLPRLIATLKADGWTLVPVDEAYADPIAELQPKVPSAQGTIVELAAWQRGLPAPRWYERNNERVVQALFDVRVLGLPTPSAEETE
jgi:peptidoglycan/xylan/chitin deacetylase (PgdA/CDA1 family)